MTITDTQLVKRDDVFFVSDPHFMHKRVSRNRGYETPEAHDEQLINNIMRVIPRGSVLFVLGDLSVNKDLEALNIMDNIKKALDLTLVLTPGNHDKIHPMFGINKNLKYAKYYNEVFDMVSTTIELAIPSNGKALFSHIPANNASLPYSNPHTIRWAPQVHDCSVIVHGHTHSDILIDGNHINLSLEATNMMPVNMNQLVKDLVPIAASNRKNNKKYRFEDIFS